MIKKLKNRIKAAWKVLTKKNVVVHASNGDASCMLKDAILIEALRLHQRGALPLERFQMINSVIFDRSVILQGIHRQDDVKYIPTVIYDCATEEDFNELRNQIID